MKNIDNNQEETLTSTENNSEKIIDINIKRPITQLAATENEATNIKSFDDLQQQINDDPLTLRKFFNLFFLLLIIIAGVVVFWLLMIYMLSYAKNELKDSVGGNEDILTYNLVVKEECQYS